jgi:ribosomal protein S27AE
VKTKKTITVSAITCPDCGDIIFSRARHDYRSCTCGKCAIDGGFDYIKISALKLPKIEKIEVAATLKELYNDWNENKNVFGLIKKKV